LQPFGRWIACDDCGINSANRDTRNPVGLAAGFGERLIDSNLVGTESTAALQHERHPIVALGDRRDIVPERLRAWRTHDVHFAASASKEGLKSRDLGSCAK
jgi:hypothetical protein